MKYKVFVDDNFHYMDESDRYLLGEYDSMEEALEACRNAVDDFLKHALSNQSFEDADSLFAHFRTFGEDPFIVSGDKKNPFSSLEYARIQCRKLVR